MTYTYDRIWDGSGDSIGWALSDEAANHAAFVLEHPDDGPVVVAIPQEPGHGAPCWIVQQCRDVDDAARCLSRHFGTDARPDDAAPARCIVATVRFDCVCVMCRKPFQVVEHIQAGEEIDPAYQTCQHCGYHRGHTGTATLVNVRSERTPDA